MHNDQVYKSYPSTTYGNSDNDGEGIVRDRELGRTDEISNKIEISYETALSNLKDLREIADRILGPENSLSAVKSDIIARDSTDLNGTLPLISRKVDDLQDLLVEYQYVVMRLREL